MSKCPRCGYEEQIYRPKGDADLPDLFKSWAIRKYPARRDAIMKWQSWGSVPQYLRDEYRRKLKGARGANNLQLNERADTHRGGPDRPAGQPRASLRNPAPARVRPSKA